MLTYFCNMGAWKCTVDNESHLRQVAILVLDDKLDCFGLLKTKFGLDKTV